METYTRKQLMKITGLPDKTLRWLLSKLEIDPVFTTKTAFGRPIYHYDYATLVCLHDYIFKQAKHKEECNRGAIWPPLLVFSILNEVLNIKVFCGFNIQV